jgi:hypothetical protein
VSLLAALAVAMPAVAAGPPARDSVGAAISRIQSALATPGCSTPLRALLHSSYGKANPQRACTYVRKSLGTFKSPRGMAYGSAAEIDAGTGYAIPATVVLALDGDGRFHIVFVEFNYGSIGSKPNPVFTKNARAAVAAIRTGDCGGFLKVAYRAFGLGGGSDSAVCSRLPGNSLHRALAADPKAKLKNLGGNSLHAFYGISAGGRYWTIVMAQQTPSASLPVDAARYAFVDAYPS